MKNGFRLTLLLGMVCGVGWAQSQNMMVGDKPVRISEHVWGVMGFPNIGIVVGDRATLVVDTGLGRPNGEKVARMAAKLATPGSTKLFLTTTHFHPEHAGGVQGFPASTIVVWDAMQQQEMEKHGKEMIEMFRGRSSTNAALLAGTVIPVPDVTFDTETALNLGGVRVRLLWFGEAHTKGDELIFVEGDNTLISGDVVQNKTAPRIFGDGGTPTSWLAVLDKIAALPVQHVLPDHSAPGDGSLVVSEKELIQHVRSRALELKQQGVTADDAGQRVSGELKTEHPDWANTNVSDFVKRVYAER
jgi:glyoxylase-like metal-dependent hydrolase (beta-lactamase superfamily II)